MKIYLFCSAGMSTSLLVTKMQKAAEEQGINCYIEAFAESKATALGPDADVVLLGPQIRFRLKAVQEALPTKPVMVINMQDYGMVNGAGVLKAALDLYEEHNKG